MGCTRLGTAEDKAAVEKQVQVAEAKCVAPDCTGAEVERAFELGGMPAVRALQAEKEAEARARNARLNESLNSGFFPSTWSNSPPSNFHDSNSSSSLWNGSSSVSNTTPNYSSPSHDASSSVSPSSYATTIEHRTAPADPNYFVGERFVDPRAWAAEVGIVMYRDQDNNNVLSVEGWIQPNAFEKGTRSLSADTKDLLKGDYAGDSSIHLAHCFARCFGGPLIGNLGPFPAAGNLAMSPLEKELRDIADSGIPLYVQGVFHRENPDDNLHARHEIAVFMRSPDSSPRQVGLFEVDAHGVVSELPYWGSEPSGWN